MTQLLSTFRKATTAQAISPFRLTRTYVLTGDERCPLAGIWLSLADDDLPTEDPELPRPVMRKLLPWRAFHPTLTTLRYSAA